MVEGNKKELNLPTGIPPQFREKYTVIAGVISAYCEDRFDDDFKALCLHALQKLCRKRTEPMASGRNNMWAAGIIYAIAQNCNMIGNNGNMLIGRPGYRLKSDDLCAALGASKGGVSEKAKAIRKELAITQNKEEWLLPSQREGSRVLKDFNKVMRILR
ncbi:MAG: hypothetical protein IJ695_10100 [Butyrivibrio sp.]|nr:hypothetical protein [Butyrivibrio sp.]